MACKKHGMVLFLSLFINNISRISSTEVVVVSPMHDDSANTQQSKCFFRKDYTYFKETESFYKFHTLHRNFQDAMNTCLLEGATLFYPQNKNEARVILDFWSNTQPSNYISIGVASFIVPGVYETVDGTLFSNVYNKWGPGEPSDAVNERCVELNRFGYLNDMDCNLLRPFICKKTLSSVTWNSACNLPDMDYHYDSSVGKCYKFHLEPKSWTNAYITCNAEQSYLAIVNSPLENEVLVRLTANAPKDTVEGDYLRGAVHLGFRKLKTPPLWVTITGQKFDQTGMRWVSGQPDNSSGDEMCGSMFYTGQPNDIACSQKMFFICEHDVK